MKFNLEIESTFLTLHISSQVYDNYKIFFVFLLLKPLNNRKVSIIVPGCHVPIKKALPVEELITHWSEYLALALLYLENIYR